MGRLPSEFPREYFANRPSKIKTKATYLTRAAINEKHAPSENGVRGTLAYVAGVFPTYSETFVYREVLELRRRGWTVHVCTLKAPGPDERRGLSELLHGVFTVYGGVARAAKCTIAEIMRHPLRSTCTLVLAVSDAVVNSERLSATGRAKGILQGLMSVGIARELRKRQVQHIHCHFAHAPTTVGMYAALQLGVPFSFTGHANDLFQRRALLRVKLQRAAFVACISRWHRKFYQAIFPDDRDRYRVIRCGVDVDQWTPRVQPRLDDGPLRVVTVCRLMHKKGVDLLIDALHRFASVYSRGVQLRIIGDGPERAALEAQVRRLSFEKHVAWMGAMDNRGVRDELADADLFALLCRVDRQGDQDGIPVALMEAMSCAIPVLAGKIPSVCELVEDRVTGSCLDATDANALVDRLQWLVSHPREAAEWAQCGRRRIQEEFSLQVNVDRLEECFSTDMTAGSGRIRGGLHP